MKVKIMFARGMSRVLFLLLYIADIAVIYHLTGDASYTAIGASAILVLMGIRMGVSLLVLRAHSLRNYRGDDVRYLQSCMDEVMERSVSIGRKRTKVRLFIADNASLNCFTVGRSIVVNRGIMELGDRTMLEANLGHELSHVYNLDSYFAALLEMNIFAGLCVLGLSLFGMAVAVVLIAALIFGLIFSSWIGFTAAALLGKAAKGFIQLVRRIYYYFFKAFSAFLYRRQEFEADRYTALLGYSRAMVGFFSLNERVERKAVQTSWMEDLLNDHPSDYRRIVQFEKMSEQIVLLEQARREEELLLDDNPFQ